MSLALYNTPNAVDRTSVALTPISLGAACCTARRGEETTVHSWNNQGRRGRSG